MKTTIQKTSLIGLTLTFLIALSACGTELSYPGSKVDLVSELSPSDFERYDDIGRVTCQEFQLIPNIEESCRNELRNRAANLGADVVLVESVEPMQCFPEASSDCLQMSGRALRKRHQDW